jgi:hypothetical protein
MKRKIKKKSRKCYTRALDTVFAKIVKIKGICVRCGAKEQLQCCHIYSRRYKSIRWEELNALCLCAGCHFLAHQNPIDFGEFVREKLGVDYERLKQLRNTQSHFTTDDLKNMLDGFLKKYSQ